MNNPPTVNLTLEEIIKRKIAFYRKAESSELETMRAGYIRGFEQTLADVGLSEEEFTQKYLAIVRDLEITFDALEQTGRSDEDIDELSGYNNAIVEVLSLLDKRYMYADNI